MSIGPINPPPLLNTQGRLVSKSVSALQDETRTVFDVDIDGDSFWTIGFQEEGTGAGQFKLEYKRELVTLKQEISFGKDTGDFLTGVGPFRLTVTGTSAGGCAVSVFWTLQPKTIDVGQFADASQTVASAATFDNLGSFGGSIPFPYNEVSIFSTAASFQVKLVDQAGNDVQSPMNFTPPSNYLLKFSPPPNTRVKVSQTTGSDKKFTPVYSRS